MTKYKNLGGGSNVVRFLAEENSITIEFSDGSVLRYDDKIPGRAYVNQMKLLATSGQGLFAYIQKYVKKNFAEKIK
jgi:hypothetical protein